MATNFLSLRSTVTYNSDRSSVAQGSLYGASTNNTQAWLSTLSLPGFSTITGSTIVGSTLISRGPISVFGQQTANPTRFIELGTDTANTSYIDFHSSDAALADYSTRILSQGGSTIGGGALQLYGSSIGLNTLATTSQFQVSSLMTANLGDALKTQLTTDSTDLSAFRATYNGTLSGPTSGVMTLTNTGGAANSVVEFQSNLLPGATYRVTLTVKASSSNSPYIILTDRNSIPPDAGINTSLGGVIYYTNSYATYIFTFVAPSSRMGLSFVPDNVTSLNATTQWNAFTLQRMDVINTSLGYGSLGFKNDLNVYTYGYGTPYQCTIASAGANGFTATQSAGVNYGSIPYPLPYVLLAGTVITFSITLSSTASVSWWALFNDASRIYHSTATITSTPTTFTATVTLPSKATSITIGFLCAANAGNLTFNNIRITLATSATISNGPVGIGSTAGPSYALDVYGTGRFAGGTNLGPADDTSMPAQAYSYFGKNWQDVPQLSTSAVWYGIAVSNTGAYLTANIAGGAGTIWYSQNYGQSWQQASITANQNYGPVTMSGTGQYQFCGINSAAGSIYRSTNYGATWTLVSGTTTNGFWYQGDSSTDGSRMYITQSSGASATVWGSTDYGATWTSLAAPTGGSYYDVACSSDGKYVFACQNTGYIYSSSNYGSTWTQRATSLSWTSITCSASGQYLCASVNNGTIWYSVDFGVTWAQNTNAIVGTWYSIRSSSSGQYVLALTSGVGGLIYYSADYGVSWTGLGGGFTGTFQFLAMSQNGLYSYVVVNGGGVYRSILTYPSLVTTGMAQIGKSPNNYEQPPVNVPLYITGGNPSQARVQIWATDEVNATWRIGTPSAMNIGFGGNQGHYVNLGYYSGNTTKFFPQFTLDTTNNFVGIGTAGPAAVLHAYNSNNASMAIDTTNASQCIVSLRKDGVQKGSMYVPGSSSTIAFYNDTTGYNIIEFRGTGYVHLNTTRYTDGTLSVTSGQVVSASDQRIKSSITYVSKEGHLDKLLQIKPATYCFTNTPYSDLHLGFIAQDVETLFPLCVDGKKYEYVFEVEKDEYGNDTTKPRLDEQGEPIWRRDEKGERIIRVRGFDDRALLAHTILSIQEWHEQRNQMDLSHQSTVLSMGQSLSTLQSNYESLQSNYESLQTEYNSTIAGVLTRLPS